MKANQLKALKQSILKWELIVGGFEADRAENNCALCKLYMKDSCLNCPVRDSTYDSNCVDTPYEPWYEEMPYWNGLRIVTNEATKQLAHDELNFLKSLLPDDE